MNKVLIAIIALLLAGGAWYMYSNKGGFSGMTEAEYSMGSYEYMCADGTAFTMEPSSDGTLVRISGLAIPQTTLSFTDGTAGQRFEGGDMVFVGAGEEVQLTRNGSTISCNPKPSTENAPWNWGDAGEGGGIQQDVSLIVSESIVGKWKSVDDAKYVRELKADFTASEWYEGKEVSKGLWVAFTKMNAPEISFPLEENAVYLQMTMQGTQADTLNFKIAKLTPEELELVYMDRGGVLRFTRVE